MWPKQLYIIWKLNKYALKLVYGLLGKDKIWPKYNYLNILESAKKEKEK